MDSNNWRAAQAQAQAQLPVQGNEAATAATGAAMETGDWRSQLPSESRQRIVIKIMETLKRHLPFSGQEGLQELKNIAERFEEKIYVAATSQQDYLKKISLRMLTMETKSQNPMANAMQATNANSSKNPTDSASGSMAAQVPNQGQPLSIPMMTNQPQAQQQLLSQNIQNNMNSANMTSALPTVGGLTQTTMANVVNQNSSLQNMQNISNVTQNSMANSMGRGMASNMFANSQRQMPGRQQQVVPQQPQQSQNSQHFLYQQQLQHQLMKQKFQQGSIAPPQTHIQQQQQQQKQQQQQPNLLQSSQHTMMQSSVMLSNLQNNQQTSSQQSTQSIVQQHPQTVRQQQLQQPQQAPMIHQQQTSMSQQSILATQQQQPQMMGQQQNGANMQQNQLINQPNSISDMQQQQQQQQQSQQQRIMGQQNSISNLQQQQQQQQLIGQNNLANMHQPQLGPQSGVSGLQQQQLIGQNNLANMHQPQLGPQSGVSGLQQQQVIGTQSNNAGIPSNQQSVHMLQQSKLPAQQQIQQTGTNLLSTQGQQSQPQVQLMQQQLISQMQSQPAQMQQPMGVLQQQANTLQRDMQQRLRTMNPSLHHQNVIDQQKQQFQSQRQIPEASSTASLDSTPQTGSVHGADWQEEAYQKIRSMKEMYFAEINEFYQKIAAKLQQPKKEQIEKLKIVKAMLEKMLHFLRLNKNEIQLVDREKIASWEKQIVSILNSNRPRKPIPSLQQGQLSQPPMHAMQPNQQPQSQISQIQPHENQMNNQMQPLNVQGPVTSMQQNNLANLQQNSLSSASNISNPQQTMMNNIQPGSNLDAAQGNAQNSLQQVPLGSLQQNPVSGAQQMNINSIASQSGLNPLQSNLNPMQPNANMIPHQHLKQQEQQMLQTQQLKQQIQQRNMHQQILHRQQLIQQQQQQQHTRQQQQPGQLAAHQMSQIHQMTDASDLKMRQQMGVKSGILQQHHQASQRAFHAQQMKSGAQFPISSPQVHQAVSPQIPQHPSPQIDQQNSLTTLPKVGTPLQSSSSPFIVPSPSTPLAPSPMPVESEKFNPGASSLSNSGIIGQQQPTLPSVPGQSLAIGTPGISASPLLAEFTSSDGTHGLASTIVAGKSSAVEQPHERLMKAVKSISHKALSASVSDISSVVSMVDRIAGSAPGNGSRAAVGEDLVAMTKCRLQARNFFTQDGPPGTKKMRRHTSAMPSNVVSSAGSVNDSFRQLNGSEASDLESTATSCIKRHRVEANHALVEEIQEINRRLIDTVVDISNEDVDPTVVDGAAEGGEGTIVRCSFSAVALCPNLKSQYASAQMSPIQPLRLLIPNNYPNCCPIFLDKFPVEVSKEYEDLSIKAKSRFSISLRSLRQPMSLAEIARTWDVCARAVISEYVQQSGGGSFSSKYGTWENCLSAA